MERIIHLENDPCVGGISQGRKIHGERAGNPVINVILLRSCHILFQIFNIVRKLFVVLLFNCNRYIFPDFLHNFKFVRTSAMSAAASHDMFFSHHCCPFTCS